ncbi:innexin inx7 isoform X1 [Schistocerca cancellata]|uniref:innexin inx7 isoform X1 n=1 Tax=Schistocerca cancellata TaxID=274614 RepID=UPI0021187E73|nr:innexin inx7 isoform X1 [Schistocerca cancellata]
MLKTFEEFSKNIKFKVKLVSIDNLVFKLHYRVTFVLLLVCTILVTSRQYIGEHIRCINDNGVPNNVIETFCFFTSTYTVVRHLDPSAVLSGGGMLPGVGPDAEGEPVVRHAYYQWVPFVLFLQALAFYIPHWIWRNKEGGRLKVIVNMFEYAALVSSDVDITVNNKKIPSRKAREENIAVVRKAFLERLHLNRPWAMWMVFCEVLNAVNLVAQFALTNAFLGGQFLSLGPKVVETSGDDADILDIVFPKVTKCTFHKYGPSGSLQKHDALCVMALNIINEKIYVCLWFWFVILSVATALGLLWRLFTFVFHSRSNAFNRRIFKLATPQQLEPYEMITVTRKCYYSDWLFLYYLAKNLDGFVFKDIFVGLAIDFDNADTKALEDLADGASSKATTIVTDEEKEPLQEKKDS